jgi:hypothetical protein
VDIEKNNRLLTSLLLDAGATLQQSSTTPLQLAVANGSADVAELFISQGMEVRIEHIIEKMNPCSTPLALLWPLRCSMRGPTSTTDGVEMVFCWVHSERVVSSVELAVRFGNRPVLTDVDRVPAFIYPLLRRAVTARPGSGRLGGSRWIIMG